MNWEAMLCKRGFSPDLCFFYLVVNIKPDTLPVLPFHCCSTVTLSFPNNLWSLNSLLLPWQTRLTFRRRKRIWRRRGRKNRPRSLAFSSTLQRASGFGFGFRPSSLSSDGQPGNFSFMFMVRSFSFILVKRILNLGMSKVNISDAWRIVKL